MEVNHEIPKSLVNRDSLPLNLPRRPPDVLITSSSAGAKGAGRPNHAATSTLPHVIIPHHDSSPALVQGSTDDQAIPDPNGDSNGHRVAPEPNKRALYVGGLDSRVTEEMLRQIFETSGHVQNVKVITDRTVRHACTRGIMHLN